MIVTGLTTTGSLMNLLRSFKMKKKGSKETPFIITITIELERADSVLSNSMLLYAASTTINKDFEIAK